MPDGTDWIMLPVTEGHCRYESLKRGDLLLTDVLRMNNAVAVRRENERRIAERARRA